MSKQDPKFTFDNDRIYHSEGGEPIPQDEPVVVLRGKDEVALLAIKYYVNVMSMYPGSKLAMEHASSMRERVEAFTTFQHDHPDRVGMGCHTCDHLDDRERLQYLPSIELASKV